MGKEDLRIALEAIEGSVVSKTDPYWESLKKIDEQLVEAEQTMLQDQPYVSIIEIAEEAALIIRQRHGLDKPSHFLGSTPEKFEKTFQFYVDFIGYHGHECYTKAENEGKFLDAVRGGKQVTDLIKSIKLTYQRFGYKLVLEIAKVDENSKCSVNWNLGDKSEGTLEIENNNLQPLIKLLANGIASEQYIVNIPAGGPSWADPGYGGGLS